MCEECFQLSVRPDGLSRRKTLFGVPLKDMKQMDEDERVDFIVDHLTQHKGETVAVLVDTGPQYQGKGDRMISKIKAKLPSVEVRSRANGPVINVETITLIHT
jgi:hypothetical protein